MFFLSYCKSLSRSLSWSWTGTRTLSRSQSQSRHFSGPGLGPSLGKICWSPHTVSVSQSMTPLLQVLGPPMRRASGDSSALRQLGGGYTLVDQRPLSSPTMRLGRSGPPIQVGPTGRTLSQEDLEGFGLSVEVADGEFRSPGGQQATQQFRLQQQFSQPPLIQQTSKFSSAAGTPTTQFSPASGEQFRLSQTNSEQFSQQFGAQGQQFSQQQFPGNLQQFSPSNPSSHFTSKPAAFPPGKPGTGRHQL